MIAETVVVMSHFIVFPNRHHPTNKNIIPSVVGKAFIRHVIFCKYFAVLVNVGECGKCRMSIPGCQSKDVKFAGILKKCSVFLFIIICSITVASQKNKTSNENVLNVAIAGFSSNHGIAFSIFVAISVGWYPVLRAMHGNVVYWNTG